jgi:protein-L-isoaspartate(D-aspartate) O-methyltransferase
MTTDDDTAAQRDAMVADIERLAGSLLAEGGHGAISSRVLEAMRGVPRHVFVPEREKELSYLDQPLPIGYRQTISQPFIVALMTELLAVEPDHKVLEVGTGSGYQAAVLAKLAKAVFTIEISEPLAERAAAAFAELGLANIVTRVGDGWGGWPEEAPFDGIIVTAAPDHIPAQLVQQLKPGGRLVIPVGGKKQTLLVVERAIDGATSLREVIPVCFVPLTRSGAASE